MAKKYITPEISTWLMDDEDLLGEVSGDVKGQKVVGITNGEINQQVYHSDSKGGTLNFIGNDE